MGSRLGIGSGKFISTYHANFNETKPEHKQMNVLFSKKYLLQHIDAILPFLNSLSCLTITPRLFKLLSLCQNVPP